MKKIFALGWMLVAALALTNCSKEEAFTEEPISGAVYEIVSNPETRTTNDGMNTKWAAEDAVNVFYAETGSEVYVDNNSFTISEENLSAGKFLGTLTKALDINKSYDWFMFYPYSSYIKSPANYDTGYSYIGGRSDRKQSQKGINNMDHIAGTNYPMTGKVSGVAGSETPAITMKHISALIAVNVTNSTDTAINVSEVAVTVDGESLVGTFYYNQVTGEYTDGNYVSNTATLAVTDGTIAAGANGIFYLATKPFYLDKNDFTVNIVTEEGATVSKTIAPIGVAFNAGKIKTVNITVNEDNIEYPEVATPATWSLMTSAEDIISGGEYVILAQNAIGTWSYLPTTAVSQNPQAVAQEIFDGTTTVYENMVVPFAMRWTITKNDEGNFVLTTADGNYLSCGEKAQTIAIGATMDSWIAGAHSKNSQRIAFMSVNNSRYLGIYLANPSWRGYVGDAESGYGTDGVGAQIILYYCGTYTAKSPLATPANVTATVQNDTEVVVSWDAVDNAANYTVACGTEVATVTGTTHTFTELAQGLSYNITVVAHPEAGSTKYSDSAAATTSVEIPNASNAILTENFDDITTGNNTSTSGSSTAWTGNDNFTASGKAYKAGGAVRLGSGSATGTITSKALDLSKPFSVTVAVKGWSSVEGKLKVTVNGQEQTITYTEKMTDGFGAYTVDFDAATASSQIVIATTAKRAFIDSVIVTAK